METDEYEDEQKVDEWGEDDEWGDDDAWSRGEDDWENSEVRGIDDDEAQWADDDEYDFERDDDKNNEAIGSHNVIVQEDQGGKTTGGADESAIGCWDCDETNFAGPFILFLILLFGLFMLKKSRSTSGNQRSGYRPVPGGARTKLRTN